MNLKNEIYGTFFPNSERYKAMVFVDGENLAIRYANQRGAQPDDQRNHFLRDVFVWSDALIKLTAYYAIQRTYFYTAMQGSEADLAAVTHRLKDLRIPAPRVFKRTKNRRSKRVDISLATDMLSHAHRRNFNVAFLIAGDEDYVPLVDAVQREGAQVWLWALPDGLSPALQVACDGYADLTPFLFGGAEDTTQP